MIEGYLRLLSRNPSIVPENVLAETFGNNRLLNAARRWRWQWSGLPDEAGEEIILDDRHIELLRRHLRRVEVTPVNLLAMGKRLFRGRFESRGVRAAVRALEASTADGTSTRTRSLRRKRRSAVGSSLFPVIGPRRISDETCSTLPV